MLSCNNKIQFNLWASVRKLCVHVRSHLNKLRLKCLQQPIHYYYYYYYIILIINFMQGIYIHIPETNHVSRAYSVAAVLYLQFVLHVILCRLILLLLLLLYAYVQFVGHDVSQRHHV
jgi:hypothetical protein